MAADDKDNDPTRSFIVLAAGVVISHYKIISKIGAGGMGEVWLAEDTELNRKVALKFLPPHLCQDENCRARFKREAQATAKLDHPNVVTIYEVSEFQGRPYFAMQYVSEISLKEYMAREKLSMAQVVEITTGICHGLSAAHQVGIIHRDIKPANILVDDSNNPKIVDFGLAHVVGATKLTKTGSTLGTVGYMSPEMVRGEKVDVRSDIFSLGVVLYEMITGIQPFREEYEAATTNAILNETPQPLARYCKDIPDELQQIVNKALDKDKETRYQTASGMLADLRRLRSDKLPARKSNLGLWIAAATVIIVAGYFLINNFWITDRAKKEGRGNSIAVLIFRDQSPNKDQDYFCEGMTDAIIGRLSGIQSLKVISLTSVLRFKEPDRDLKKIGKALGVQTILEGSIAKENGSIRVRAQLINVNDDAHIWSDHYDRELKSVFAVQDDISLAIVDAMKIKLLGEDTTIITRRYTQNIEAYNFYMRGRHLWSKRTERDIRKAIEHFEKAIELDPNYALAYSGLADAWGILPGYLDVPGAVTRAEANANAREAAQMAIGLDENLAEAHTSLARILWNERDLEDAEKEFLQAIELNPGCFWAHYWYSMLLEDMAKYPEQIREEDIAFELNPMSIPLVYNRVWRKIHSFEWQEAEELFQRLIEIEPNRWQSYINYAYVLAQRMGRDEDAIRQCSLAVQVDKRAYSDFAYIYEWIGDLDKALWAANKYIESTPDTHSAYDTRGDIYALNGMLDSAIASFQKALEIKPDFTLSLRKLGNMHMFRQEYAKAESLYQILASHPDKETRANGRLYLTQIPLHQGKLKEGLRMLEELKDKAIAESVRSSEELAFGFYKRGIIYEEILNDQASSTAEYEKVLETLKDINPNSWMIAFSRGNIANNFAKEGNFEKADQLLKELEQDLDRYGPSALKFYWRSVSRIEEQKGNYDLARTYLEKVYKGAYTFYLARRMGQNYLMAGRPEDAVKVLEKMINRYELNRALWPAVMFLTHFYLGHAYEEAGRNEDAIDQYEIFLDIWKNADEGLKSVKDAKERLEKLKNKI